MTSSWPWSELGLEPTGDKVRIKKAYAAVLKHTRPDDDAAAYQKLRSAYDAALEEARWRTVAEAPAASTAEEQEETRLAAGAECPTSEPPTSPTPTPHLGATSPAAQHAEAQDGEEEQQGGDGEQEAQDAEAYEDEQDWSDVSPELESLLAELADGTPHDHDVLWTRLRRALDEVPLGAQAHVSVRCARLVVQNPALPSRLALALADHFGWRVDFRQADRLGFALHHELQAALEHHAAIAAAVAASPSQEDDAWADAERRVGSLFAGLLGWSKTTNAVLFATVFLHRLNRQWSSFLRRFETAKSPAAGRIMGLSQHVFPVATLLRLLLAGVGVAAMGALAAAREKLSPWEWLWVGLTTSALSPPVVDVFRRALRTITHPVDDQPDMLEPLYNLFPSTKPHRRFLVSLALSGGVFALSSIGNPDIPSRAAVAQLVVTAGFVLTTRQVWNVTMLPMACVLMVDAVRFTERSSLDPVPWSMVLALLAANHYLVQHDVGRAIARYERPYACAAEDVSRLPWYAWLGFKAVVPTFMLLALVTAPRRVMVACRRDSPTMGLSIIALVVWLHIAFPFIPMIVGLWLFGLLLPQLQRAAEHVTLRWAVRVVRKAQA
ncbi:MAG: hypothetical protein AB2A00_13350 [Myxococcota bacterium]